MKTVALCTVLCVLSVILLPVAAGQVTPAAQPVVEDRLLLIEQPTTAGEENDTAVPARSIVLHTEDGTQRLALDEYLTAVVLCEMPPSFELEALCAQAVAARTFALRQTQRGKHMDGALCDDSACCQAWKSREALAEQYAEQFECYWEKAAAAVSATQDEVLVYDGQLIEATYFSCSGGRTEAAVAVWGSDVPYLQSVASYGEQDALRYTSEAVFSPEEFRQIMTTLAPDAVLNDAPQTWIGAVEQTAGGGVATICIGGAELTGTQMRSAFALNSTQFTLHYTQGMFRFDVLGFGHRVGMSQYGANYMAQQGYSYRVILPYYYRGVAIKTLAQLGE